MNVQCGGPLSVRDAQRRCGAPARLAAKKNECFSSKYFKRLAAACLEHKLLLQSTSIGRVPQDRRQQTTKTKSLDLTHS